MEGTRHEKITLVLVSYLIGFLTAFIAFGIQQSSDEIIYIPNQKMALSDSESYGVSKSTVVGFDAYGLYVSIFGGYNRLLSANRENLAASGIIASEKAGFYFSILDAEVSPNGLFVYFCEQLSENSETCNPFIYSVTQDVLYKVKIDGELFAPPMIVHDSKWTNDNRLLLNNFISITVSEPWNLTSTAR